MVEQMRPGPVDVAIVGGGPAGLVAAVYLARLRRSVAVFDGSMSRLATIPRTRNYPGCPEGITGPALLTALRGQAAAYPIEHVAGKVEALEKTDTGFRLSWAGGTSTARMVLLATGSSDIAPAMPHLAQALRTGLLRYCPVCDGYEAIDRNIGVITNGQAGVGEALYLRHFTPHVTVFMTSDAQALGPDEQARLAQAGVRLAEGVVDSIRGWDGRITVRHGERHTTCESLYGALGVEVHSTLATRVGARTDENGYVLTDRRQETDVPGLFAAGDVVLGLNQIAVAAGTAAIAGAAIHMTLSQRDRG